MRVRLVVPTSTSVAPDCATTSGTRKEPPISTSWPRDTTSSRRPASAAAASSTAPAQLLTTIAASAPVSSHIKPSTCAWRDPRSPPSRSYSKFEYPSAARATASRAESASGARPRFVWTITPEALITRRRRGCESAASHARAASTRASCPPDERVSLLRSGVPPALRIAARSASITTRAARTASACAAPTSDAASSSTDGSARSRSAASGDGAFDPATFSALEFLLPDRRLGLDPVDRRARPGESLAAMRGRCRDDHRWLRQRNESDAMLGGDHGQPVLLLDRRQDRRDLLLRHLDVGLVLERLDIARHSLEDHDRPSRRVAHKAGQRVYRQRILRHAHVHEHRLAAAHGRHERQLVRVRQDHV